MYDSLLDQDPELQKLVARAEIEGRQKTAMVIIEGRFPALTELAQQVVQRLDSPDELSRIARMMATAPSEAAARWLLGTYTV